MKTVMRRVTTLGDLAKVVLRPFVVVVIWVCCGFANVAPAADGLEAAAAIEDAFVSIIEKVEPSVVAISRERVPVNQPEVLRGPWNPRRGRMPFMEDRAAESLDPVDPMFAPNEFGTGVIIEETGLVLTNYHLVQGSRIAGRGEDKGDQRLYVRLFDRRVFEAEIKAADARSDLAVLQLISTGQPPIAGLPVVKFGPTTPVKKGQFVVALGNPYAIARDGSASASWGIISNITRRLPQERDTTPAERQKSEMLYHLGVLLQVDTRLELGTSGGALVNLKGELIGLTTSLAAISGYEKSAGFAIRLDEPMLRVIESLRQGKEVEYGLLGVMPEDVQVALDPLLREHANRIAQGGAARVKIEPEHFLPAY
ncbi:MAG: trypsin-like peptidase domain-containing protein, partial [Planctomycetota bacterium]|nr:trypsin-like peptidase domain-containing protein [Planctomycetota bacterium]